MRKLKFYQGLLFFAGIIGIVVGGAQLIIPVAFESSAGIDLGTDSNLLSEMRAAGGTLLVAGILILSGVFISGIAYLSVIISTLFYISYGLSRIISMVADGMPGSSLLIATVAEIVVGLLSLYVMLTWSGKKLPRMHVVTS